MELLEVGFNDGPGEYIEQGGQRDHAGHLQDRPSSQRQLGQGPTRGRVQADDDAEAGHDRVHRG